MSYDLGVGGHNGYRYYWICVTIFLGIIAIASAIYFELRGFANSISKKVEETKSSIALELSGIKENIVKIITKVDDLWQLASVFMKGQTVGTVEIELKNFGKTKISAEITGKETRYIVQPEKGRLMAEAIARISKISTLTRTRTFSPCVFGLIELKLITADQMGRNGRVFKPLQVLESVS